MTDAAEPRHTPPADDAAKLSSGCPAFDAASLLFISILLRRAGFRHYAMLMPLLKISRLIADYAIFISFEAPTLRH
jgi:hypothetical protein